MSSPTDRPRRARTALRASSNARRPLAWCAAGALLLAPLAAACGDDGGDPAAGLTELRIVAGEGPPSAEAGAATYRFDIPERVPEGAARLSLDNEGDEDHHAQLFRLASGRSTDDLRRALATGDPAAALQVGTFEGGTGLVAAGTTSSADAVVALRPGTYALICFVEDQAGAPHLAHGMIEPFEVEASTDPPALPEPDIEVSLGDYTFDMPDEVPADAVLEVTNTGAAEPHEMVVARLDEGATAADAVAALERHEPLPGTPVGGIQALLPGDTQHLRLDLEPGRYLVTCHVPSPDGAAHYAKGMIREVTVR